MADSCIKYKGWLYLILLTSVLFLAIVILGSCTSRNDNSAEETLGIVQEYLTAVQSGDLERARSYWTDINNPGGTWTLVARRDMEHVTRDHGDVFANGWEIIDYEFQAIEGLPHPISVLKLNVQIQPTGEIKKLEAGLVKDDERWYIYSIYPGGW